MTWIYKTLPLEARHLTEAELNRQGREGWQLICTMPSIIFMKAAHLLPAPVQLPEAQATGALLRIPEAARYLGLSRTSVYQLIHSQNFPIIRVGKAVRIPRAELDKWIAAKQERGEFGTL